MDRHALIARKQEIRRQIEQAQRELARIETQPHTWRVHLLGRRRTLDSLQRKVERLMAEEHDLRLAIDRAGKPDEE